MRDPKQYEAFTPLKTGRAFRRSTVAEDLERDDDGRLVYAWKPDTGVIIATDEHRLVKDGVIQADESWTRTVDAVTGKPVVLHRGSVRWNEHRKRWILIATETFGSPSFLGEVWYSEADKPEGPFKKAVKIVTHDKYSFYNPTQHAFFDRKGGRYIHFEGTYTRTFSGAKTPTPRYDYNQVMYRLDLEDARLAKVRR